MGDPVIPDLPPNAAAVKVTTQKVYRSHFSSIRDSVIGTVFLGVAIWYIHLRGSRENFPQIHDVAILVTVILAGLAVGYRDRLPLITTSAAQVIRAKRNDRDDT